MSGDFSDQDSASQVNESDTEDGIILPNPIFHADLLVYLQNLEDLSAELPTPAVFAAPLNVQAGFTYAQTLFPFISFGNEIDPGDAADYLENIALYLKCTTWPEFFRLVRAYLQQG